jgi:beta-glucosidase
VNGSACSQNSKLINGLLKDELGFQGFVMSDWLGQIGGVSSALAGLDMAMPGDTEIPLIGESYWSYELSTSILNGTVPVERLNDMVCGSVLLSLTLKMLLSILGLFRP